MQNTYIIGKHLTPARGKLLLDTCCLCSREPDGYTTGFPRGEVISNTFMDVGYLNGASEICEYCAACLGYEKPRTEFVKNYSYIANEKVYMQLKREVIWYHLFSPPAPPFIFCVTYNHKKHTSFKAPVNLDRATFSVCTENDIIEVRWNDDLVALAHAIQEWYTVCKDTAQAPTWFTKADILQGVSNYKRIEEYGAMKYFVEDAVISPHRQTALLELFVHALNKKPIQTAAQPETQSNA